MFLNQRNSAEKVSIQNLRVLWRHKWTLQATCYEGSGQAAQLGPQSRQCSHVHPLQDSQAYELAPKSSLTFWLTGCFQLSFGSLRGWLGKPCVFMKSYSACKLLETPWRWRLESSCKGRTPVDNLQRPRIPGLIIYYRRCTMDPLLFASSSTFIALCFIHNSYLD